MTAHQRVTLLRNAQVLGLDKRSLLRDVVLPLMGRNRSNQRLIDEFLGGPTRHLDCAPGALVCMMITKPLQATHHSAKLHSAALRSSALFVSLRLKD